MPPVTTTIETTQAAPTTAKPPAASESLPLQSQPKRYLSVDALRGVVMFVMLYVNDVAGVPHVPWWMKHYHPETANGMTFVDWVFGGFLFIVGVSIPIAFANRIARGTSLPRLIGHVLLRTAALLMLGVFMVNGETGPDPQRIGWPDHLWETLVYLFAILAFIPVPSKRSGRSAGTRAAVTLLRAFAFAGFAYLAYVYRDDRGHIMQTSWWGILGLIGWAYLVASIVYLLLRRSRVALLLAMGALLAVFVLDQNKDFFGGWPLHGHVDYGSMLGSQAAISVAGVILGTVILDPNLDTRRRLIWAVALTLLFALTAIAMYRPWGINKNDATPAWCMICAAVTCALWIVLSLIIDVRGLVRPLRLFTEGGQNVLFAYLIMPLFLHFIWWRGYEWYGHIGRISVGMGITRSLVMAALVLWLAAIVKDRGLRLRL